MQDVRRFQAACTVSRRLSVVAGFYRTCVVDTTPAVAELSRCHLPADPPSCPYRTLTAEWDCRPIAGGSVDCLGAGQTPTPTGRACSGGVPISLTSWPVQDRRVVVAFWIRNWVNHTMSTRRWHHATSSHRPPAEQVTAVRAHRRFPVAGQERSHRERNHVLQQRGQVVRHESPLVSEGPSSVRRRRCPGITARRGATGRPGVQLRGGGRRTGRGRAEGWLETANRLVSGGRRGYVDRW